MASGKMSPRQKMINMMYLVLIALLALNISNEILKAFHLMEVSFVKANQSLTDKNKGIMAAFDAAMEKKDAAGERARPWAEKAKKVQDISAKFCKDIDLYKAEIEKAAGGRKEQEKGQTGLPEMSKGDDMEGHKHYLGTDETTKGKGDELRVIIEKARKDMINVLAGVKNDKVTMEGFEKTTAFKVEDFKDENGSKKTWERDVLGHSPVAGVMAMLTKVQNDCKALETDILTKLAENIDAATIKFDKQMAVVISESTNVMSGSSFKAQVALAAYNSTAAQRILVNGSPIPVKDGLGEINIPASGVGSHKIEAKIESIDPVTGETVLISAPIVEWTSFQPSATISADAMNVLYIGLDNPMSISVPGVAPANTNPVGNGINLKKLSDGKYIATVSAGSKEGTISVTAKMPDGTSKKMGEMKYRIRQVPKPEAMLGQLGSGSYPKAQVTAAAAFVYANLANFVFDGVKFTVTKYSVIFVPRRGNMEETSVAGNSAAAIKNFANKAKAGDIILVDRIRATGPGGERPLNPITITIQ
jgi:gliding motility-associated protein GldM